MEDTKQESVQKNCTRCGKELEEKTAFCPACGLPVEMQKENKEETKEEPKTVLNNTVIINNVLEDNRPKVNKWLALALCFFVGSLGFHKFYEGKIGLG